MKRKVNKYIIEVWCNESPLFVGEIDKHTYTTQCMSLRERSKAGDYDCEVDDEFTILYKGHTNEDREGYEEQTIHFQMCTTDIYFIRKTAKDGYTFTY